MANYKLATGGVIRTSDGAFIPDCPGNRDWQEYQEWLTIPGNMPDPQYSLEEVKEIKKLELRSIASNRILEFYPIYRQLNINELQQYTQADKDRMWAYINDRRNCCNDLENEINNATDIETVNNISWPISKQVIEENVSSQANGTNTIFKLAHRPLCKVNGSEPINTDVIVKVNGIIIPIIAIQIGNKFNEDAAIIFEEPPLSTDIILVDYYYKI